MKVAVDVLRRYIELPPHEGRVIRDLLDDIGVEVKREERGPQGTVYTVELLANRGDHYCYHGVAREISGRTGEPVTLPDITPLTVGASPIPVKLLSRLCLVYTITLLEAPRGEGGRAWGGTPAPAPMRQQGGLGPTQLRPLLAAGLDSVHAAVDATNLANLELGQPTHAFDADLVDGEIVVRESKPGETAWLLFTPERRPVPPGTLVIADRTKILAIAGVIGCEDSKTTAGTRRILLESGTFDPVAVRKAARALDVHTDSSARFERGGDPSAPLVGAGRVVALLEEIGWRRVGATGRFGTWVDPDRQIPVEIGAIASFLESPLTAEQIRERLPRYGFEVSPDWPDYVGEGTWRLPDDDDRPQHRVRNTVLVRVPPHRLWDVDTLADVAEELAKSIGYGEIEERLPDVGQGALPSASEVRRRLIDDVFVGFGFHEVFTDGFYSREMFERLGLTADHPLQQHVETLNALDRGYSLLKNNALVQAVEAVAANLRLRTPDVRCWEWTRTFHPNEDAENHVCFERRTLWAVACGPRSRTRWDLRVRDADPWWLKGIVGEIAAAIGVPLEVGPADPDHPLAQALHPNRQAAIRLGDRVVGVLGEVHPRVCQAFKIKRERPVYLEINHGALLEEAEAWPYVEPPDTPPVERNLAFTLPMGVEAGAVSAHLARSGPTWLRRVDITDAFEHEVDGRPVRTITYALWFDPSEAPLTTEQMNQVTEGLIEAVAVRFGDQGVKLR